MGLQDVVDQGAVALRCAAVEGLICAALQIYVLLKHVGHDAVDLLDAVVDQVVVAVVQECADLELVAVDLVAVDVGQVDVWDNVAAPRVRDADVALGDVWQTVVTAADPLT